MSKSLANRNRDLFVDRVTMVTAVDGDDDNDVQSKLNNVMAYCAFQ